MTSPLREKRRIEAIFRALSTDYLLREQFVTDPAQILTEYVSGKRLEPEAASTANHLVYAVVSNPGLLRWLQNYANKSAQVPAGEQFTRDFARAVAQNADEQTLLAVLSGAGEPQDHLTLQTDVLRALVSALKLAPGRVVAGTEMSSPGTEISPGPGTEVSMVGVFAGTEMSPGRGTEMSPGRVFAGTEMSPGRGTEMSPGLMAGTEMSPGHGTEMSPGLMAGTEMSSPGTEMSPGHGTEMSPGLMAGTEMSSPGTEISPGPGTDMSPGIMGIDIGTTLRALVNFANELRRAGALNTLNFR
jgi:hypothetical protein